MTNQIFIGLGSNIGPRHDFIKKALKYIEKAGMSLIKVSSFYETEPVGGILQDKFINAAAQIQTTFKPEELIKIFKEIEQKLGRDLNRSEEHTSELQSHSFNSYAVFCLKKKKIYSLLRITSKLNRAIA